MSVFYNLFLFLSLSVFVFTRSPSSQYGYIHLYLALYVMNVTGFESVATLNGVNETSNYIEFYICIFRL